MNEVWQVIEPYVMRGIEILSSGAMGAFIIRLLASGWFKKHDLGQLTKDLANNLAGSKINIDMTAIAEKKLDKIKQELSIGQAELSKKLNELLVGVGDVIDSIKSSAKLNETQRVKLNKDLELIKESTTEIEEQNEILLELKSIKTKEDKLEETKPKYLAFD